MQDYFYTIEIGSIGYFKLLKVPKSTKKNREDILNIDWNTDVCSYEHLLNRSAAPLKFHNFLNGNLVF